VEGVVVHQHAIALGYFFLSIFCVFTSAHSFVELRVALLLAALMALVAGVAYVASPLIARLRAVQAWFVQIIRLAQEPPRHSSAAADEKHS
jgi:hypothetical protein